MKLLLLESFYTNFHIDLANYLSDDVHALVFNLGNIVYLKAANKIIVHKFILKANYTQKDMNIAIETKTLYTETLRKIKEEEPSFEDFEYMAKYVSFLRDYLIYEKIELVTMHNDLRWQHSLAIVVCKELDIDYLITERGIFRPDTTTIEFKGVNAYSSLSKDKEFYKKHILFQKGLRRYSVSKMTNLKVNVKFAIFILLNKIGSISGINSKLKNKSYSLSRYIYLFIKQKFSKKSDINIELPNKYIFIPLQVNTDTQILVHSDFKNIQEFISKVESDFYSLNIKIGLVFKIHPMEKGIVEYKFDKRSLVSDSDTNRLVRNSEFVITINSTVGFEAIQEYKKVLVLGDAFFKIKSIVICSSKDSFKKDLINIITNKCYLDIEAIKYFVDYIKYEYQVNGNLFNWSIETFEEIKKKLNRV